jgi:hypothetical protein
VAYTTTKGGSTSASAPDIATDEIAGAEYQAVKLIDGTAGSVTPIPGDANGLLVNLGANNDVTVTGSVTADLGANNDVTVTSGTITAVTTVTNPVAVTQSGVWDEIGINDSGNSITVDGSVAVASVAGNVTVVQGTATNLKVDASGVAVPITDNAGSLTVDGSVTAVSGTAANLKAEVVGTGTFVTQSVVTNAGTFAVQAAQATAASLNATVVGTGTFAVQADTELTTADLDTGAGTDTRAVVGLVGSKSGGAALIPGDATAGLKVDLGADNDVTITSGTVSTITNVVHVDDNSGNLSIDDGGNSITVDYATTGSGNATGALRVELPTNGTGVLATVGAVTAITNTVTTLEKRSATAALTTVADNAASTSILAANANRIKAIITNDSSARLHLRFEAAAASTANYGVSLAQHETWEELIYTGEIRGIWASDPNDGSARITEFTA